MILIPTKDNKDEREAIRFIKGHQRELLVHFIDPKVTHPSDKPFTMFMAGGPGVGKTEWALSWIERLIQDEPNASILRIDADEVKEFLQEKIDTDKINLHKAAALGVEKLFDQVQKKSLNCVVDGTMTDYAKSESNVRRALGRNRRVGITYVYLDPIKAWEYVQIRYFEKKRAVPKDTFVETFCNSYENVNRLKAEYGDKILLDIVTFDKDNHADKTYYNVENLDGYVKLQYNREELYEKLSNPIYV